MYIASHKQRRTLTPARLVQGCLKRALMKMLQSRVAGLWQLLYRNTFHDSVREVRIPLTGVL
jgi:hypothetical protein